MRELFEAHGFALVTVEESGSKLYQLDRRSSAPTACDWITVDAP